jgi:hypothetical protein
MVSTERTRVASGGLVALTGASLFFSACVLESVQVDAQEGLTGGGQGRVGLAVDFEAVARRDHEHPVSDIQGVIELV